MGLTSALRIVAAGSSPGSKVLSSAIAAEGAPASAAPITFAVVIRPEPGGESAWLPKIVPAQAAGSSELTPTVPAQMTEKNCWLTGW